MWSLPRRRIASAGICFVISLSVTACGNSFAYQAGLNQFEAQVVQHGAQNTKADWTIYVGRGTVTARWLWFKHLSPVVYAQVENTGTSKISDLVVHFGGKTVKSSVQSPDSGVEFYVESSQIPQHIDISWKVQGQSHHEIIDSKSIVELDGQP